jgi:uncharacterized protein GlcG (DUF336 family)
MNARKLFALLLSFATLCVANLAWAQAPAPYGMAINLDQAKKAMAAAEAEARKNNWNVVIAIVDSGGHMVMLQRMDNAQFGSVKVATEKAHGSAAFRRPTKAFQDLIAQGGVHLRLLNITGDASVFEGGVPIIVDGKLIGGIGVSGVTSQQDHQIAEAGASALK